MPCERSGLVIPLRLDPGRPLIVPLWLQDRRRHRAIPMPARPCWKARGAYGPRGTAGGDGRRHMRCAVTTGPLKGPWQHPP
jgi:hypothetical protein